MKNKLLEKASSETLYDSIKWLAFGFFAIIYFRLEEKSSISALLSISLFVMILFLINIKREKSLEKIEKLFEK